MIRQLLVLIVSTLILVPCALKAQEPAAKKADQPKPNRVYVKIIMPADPTDRDKDRPAVESWIAEDLKKHGQAKFTAVTEWFIVELCPLSGIPVGDVMWDGKLGDKHYCPVGADVPERSKGRIKVLLSGWGAGVTEAAVSLTDEPGSRAISGVEALKTEEGMPYFAVLIGPPPENAVAAADGKK